RADEGHDQAEDDATPADSQQPTDDPAADETADDPDDYVHDDAVAMAAHDPAGQGPRDASDDDPPQPADSLHALLLFPGPAAAPKHGTKYMSTALSSYPETRRRE